MKHASIILIAAAISLLPLSAKSQKYIDRHSPYAKVQYAGNIGKVSVGFGYAMLNKYLSVDFNYGFVPQSANDAKIHILTLKGNCQLPGADIYNGMILNGFIGCGVSYTMTRNTYLRTPDFLPDNYYHTNAIHFLPYIGMKLFMPANGKFVSGIEPYIELGTADYLLSNTLGSKVLKFKDIWNMGIGVVFHLQASS